MNKLIKIDNYVVKATTKKFFYDGCHKIYLVEDDEDVKTMIDKGWSIDDLYNIEDLEDVFSDSCPLRFISTVKLEVVVPQCKELVKFKYDDKIVNLRF